ncbi:NADPH-dependent glutamate synthase beta chain or related oxidoreductase (GltD) (PDB:1H7X) [Commensalibacter communis]|uniref:NADPH-dependent glutamate synthase beta chain or related oxidoreductase (GltD) n=1 Tax=Commensalibacter communis TaxID=2972786 RepID=A0A9W4TML8_9PROT|nr:NAD(P)-dependent oxidoreductase [Commensalibacter communis]CAI3924998.1 NADPH-dependent glutamate synthase beta chain or related oxidoreductase (GltD) (PDB:1H7X) [Commensalibacter communis]CAI3925519.1 NADPH-dependent glutamate synthase beta chain or related oxidoreductase (GltD) (PDB:1H7X) [Commensalibacter communis]CAI3935811.1 NADPH-dependent glutamate synthase beta chain or related oxidoreductase (GltD) (PDB:1H7X) [Commensalibacter communis]CAI3937462.1 NADPH-dependent glutamate synthase
MPNVMLKFISLDQQQPEKRPAEIRKTDFMETYRRFSDEQAKTQASRCSQCGVPFCSTKCPLSNYIPDWLKLTAENRLEEAYALSSETNSFPEICGRICPQDRLCEGSCVIEPGFKSVTIGAVEAYITDHAFENGFIQPVVPAQEQTQSVGIIGAGPCGLAAAVVLRQKGYKVHIYDRYDRAGGLLTYGIPTFKLEKEVVARRQKWLEDSNVVFHFNTNIADQTGEGTISFADLRQKHDAVFIATGVYQKKEVKLLGSHLNGVVQALDYLMTSQQTDKALTADMDAKGKDVIVVGGGDTAMDCLRTAIRQGAKSVKCLYRRDKANMPGSMREVKNAEEEGVEFIWQAAPEAFIGNEKIESIRALRTELGLPDAGGRQSVRIIDDSHFTLPADMVIKALGFDPEPLSELWNDANLKASKYGTVSVDRQKFMTSIDGVFAGGDIVRGASLVVWAVRDGQDAALQIAKWLQEQ